MVFVLVCPQASWENPINIMPLLTEEDRAFVAAKKEKGKEEMGIKTLARRFEGEIVKVNRFPDFLYSRPFILSLSRN